MTMPTPNQTTPDEPERARGETPEQIAARVAEKFCVLTKQADSTQEYLTRLISEELTKERSVYEEIIRDDCEEFEANEKRIADLSAETTRLAEALKEAREQAASLKASNDYAISEKDKYGKYWHDLAQERIVALSRMTTERDNWRDTAKRLTASASSNAVGLGETIQKCLEYWKTEIEVEGEKPPRQIHMELLFTILIYGFNPALLTQPAPISGAKKE